MIRTALLLLTVMLAASPALAEQRLYLAAGHEINTFRVDPDTGKLEKMHTLDLPGAGPLEPSNDRGRLYAAAARPDAPNNNSRRHPAIATLRIQPNGSLKLINNAAVNLYPTYLMTDATSGFIAGNHYGAGKASVWKLEDGVYRGETVQELPLEKRAHAALFSASNRWMLVPATGPNKVFINRFDSETGRLTPNDPPYAKGPTGKNEARQPRHLIFHPEKPLAYTTQERERPGVAVWKWDEQNGTLKPIQNIVTQPDDFDGFITTADLHLTPDNKFLYVSNRDTSHRSAKPGRDSIVAFRVHPETGRLKMIGHQPCERIPRSFDIDATGRFLYVAGQADDHLGVYRINPNTGELSKVTQYETGKRPIWVETVELP